MNELYFTPRHEWVRFDGSIAAVGLTEKGIAGDVVYIELPKIGLVVAKGDACAAVESVKAVTDVHAPVPGVVTAINDAVFADPDSISRQPLETWLFKLDARVGDTEGLLTPSEYAALEQPAGK